MSVIYVCEIVADIRCLCRCRLRLCLVLQQSTQEVVTCDRWTAQALHSCLLTPTREEHGEAVWLHGSGSGSGSGSPAQNAEAQGLSLAVWQNASACRGTT